MTALFRCLSALFPQPWKGGLAPASYWYEESNYAHNRRRMPIAPIPAIEETLRCCFTETGAFDYLLVTLGAQAITLPFAQLAEKQLIQATQENLLNYTRVLRAALGLVRKSVTWLTGAAA